MTMEVVVKPLRRVGLEIASSEDRDLDGIADRFRKRLAELVRVLGEVGCGELVNGKLHVVGSWAKGSERVIPDRERLVKLEGHCLIVRRVGSSGGVDIIGREGECSTGVDRRGKGNRVGACRLPKEGSHHIRGGGGYVERIVVRERLGTGGEETSHRGRERGQGLR